MALGQLALALLGITISIFLYDKTGLIITFYYNSPTHLRQFRARSYDFQRILESEVRNCEDIVLNQQEKWAVVSCDPGRDTWNTVMGTFTDPLPPTDHDRVRGGSGDNSGTGLYLYDYAASDPNSITKLKLLDFKRHSSDFHPLGIDLGPDNTLYVVNHAYSGPSLEVFRLFPKDQAATHIKTINETSLKTPNAVHVMSESELLVTNDHYFQTRQNPILAKLETAVSFALGSVTYLKLDKQFNVLKASTAAKVSFPNGITALNDSMVAVASSNTASVRLFRVTRNSVGDVVLKGSSIITVPFLPDNLRVDSNGVLLIAGHPHAPSLDTVGNAARYCSPISQAHNATLAEWCEKEVRPSMLSYVAQWTPDDGLTTLYVSKKHFGTSTTAVRDTDLDVGIVTGLYERGLLRFSEKPVVEEQ